MKKFAIINLFLSSISPKKLGDPPTVYIGYSSYLASQQFCEVSHTERK